MLCLKILSSTLFFKTARLCICDCIVIVFFLYTGA